MEHEAMMSVTSSVVAGVGRLVLNQPPLNILTRAVLARIREELAHLARDRSICVLVLSAEGKHFSAGADVVEHLPPQHAELIPEFLGTVEALDAFPLPLVAAVQGRCLGGAFELVQVADFVIAAEGASFGQPEIRLGVIAPAACALLPGLGPASAAAELLYTGDPISSREAQQLGFVWRVVPDEQLEVAALELALRIARNSPAALRLAKRALRGEHQEARAGMLRRAGRIYLDELMSTEDALEGLRAFVEKREPQWTGR